MKTLLMFSLLCLFVIGNVQSQYYKNIHVPLDKSNISKKSFVLYDSTVLDSFILAKMNQYHFPGLQACIVKDDQIIWKGAYGYANIEENRLVTDSTLFFLASVSKPVTATALMQLWEEGLFGLDDDINNYLPFSVRNPSHSNVPITFRMLLTHTSSIYDNWSLLSSLRKWGEGDSPIALDSFLVNYLVPGGSYYYYSNYYYSPPGTRWEYTNVGTALIGYLVERISTNSFEQYCQYSIFVPLGMNETSWFLANLDKNNIAMEYSYGGGSYFPYGHRGSPYYPAVQLRTSAIQLSRFLRAFIQTGQIDGIRILDSATVALMTTVQYPAIDPTQGLIWGMPEIDIPYVGTRIGCGHLGGGHHGATTFIGYSLETGENVGAIVMANGGSQYGIWDIEMELMAYGLLYNKIYAQNVKLSSSFMQANEDTLIINTEFVNPNSHNFYANAIITSTDNVYSDSIPLYNDGNHGDLQAGDGIWGNYILPLSDESEYIVDVSTTDLDSRSNLIQNSRARFTTIGPIVIDNYEFVQDTVANPGDQLYFYMYLRNEGHSLPATSLTATLTTLDTFATVHTSYYSAKYGDISPGETAKSNKLYRIVIADGSFPHSPYELRFALDIQRDGYSFWQDTISIPVDTTVVGIEPDYTKIPRVFALSQNYPNPFNSSTTIKFQIPKSEFTILKVYNIQGKEVATLVSNKLNQGNHTYTFGGSDLASGIYYYQLVAGDSREVKKMILLR